MSGQFGPVVLIGSNEKQLSRHTLKRNLPAIFMSHDEKKVQYVARAHRDLQLSVQAVDLGMHAGTAIHACF